MNHYRSENDPYMKFVIYVPKSIGNIIQALSNERRIPVSRLFTIAADNELDQKIPFYYPTDLPTDEYQELAYVDEAGKILRFLETAVGNTARDTLILFRREMGIPSRKVFMLALRELFQKDLVTEIKPKRPVFQYADTYKYVVSKLKEESRKLQTKKFKKAVRRGNE